MIKDYFFFISLFFASLAGLLGCASNDEQPFMVVTPDTIEPDTTTNPTRTYSTENFSVGDWYLEIYVPSDYDSTSQYPIIYLNDGDLFSDVYGSLTSINTDAFIMVGISGDNDRAERFLAYQDPVVSADLGAYTPSASIYSDAIIDEIMPFVEGKYNINNNKKAFFGISLGGLHATWMAIKYPQVFDFIGALSPSYWVANEAIFEESLSSLDPPGLPIPTKIYFDRGSLEWRNHLSFISKLKTAGLNYGQSLFYYEVVGANHSPENWQLRIDIPFKIFMEGVSSTDEPTLLEFRSYCSNDLTNNETSTTRLNPIIHYDNGIKFSVISEVDYTITQGDGSIADDGTYTISSGASMVIEAEYKGLTDTETVAGCN